MYFKTGIVVLVVSVFLSESTSAMTISLRISNPNVDVNAKMRLKDYDPDMFLNVSQLISSKGYPVEEYDVQTADGYILSMQRIPYGRNGKQNSTKLPIYLQHGLLGCASDWVTNFPNQSFGFLLADAGYDVWLGNVRGNAYSRKHTKYSVKSTQFWKFSFDEMAKYDVPAMIDFVLEKTGKDQLYYVGHSQGTTIGFGLLSEEPEYNKKVRAFLAFAPVATVGHIKSPIRFLAPFAQDIEILFRVLGVKEFLPNNSLVKFFSRYICNSPMKVFCEELLFLLCGADPAQTNITRIPVYTNHDPAGTSAQNIIHWAQMVNAQKFVKYDYGPGKNMVVYGQSQPPEYYVGKIDTPVALFWGLNDWLSDPTDVAILEPKLSNLIESYRVDYDQWAHLDFIWGLEAPSLLYKEAFKVLDAH